MGVMIKTVDKRVLKSLSPLNNLHATQLEQLISSSGIERYGAGSAIHKEKEGPIIYLLSGSIVFTHGDEINLAIKAGTPEACLPLNYYWNQTSVVHAKTRLTLLTIEKTIFDQLFVADEIDGNNSYRPSAFNLSVEDSAPFQGMPLSTFQPLLSHIEEISVAPGDIVISQGSVADNYYIIKKGKFAVIRKDSNGSDIEIAELSPGAGFGEEGLITNLTRSATIIARQDGILIKIAKQDFMSYMLAPSLRSLSGLEADAIISKGAIVIDVDDVSQQKKLTVHQYIPLIEFRNQLCNLKKECIYIVCCGSGHKSAVAAFLLSQIGFTAFMLANDDQLVSTNLLRAELVANNLEKITKLPEGGAEVINFPKARIKAQESISLVSPPAQNLVNDPPLLSDIINPQSPERTIHNKAIEWAAKRSALESAKSIEEAALKAAEAEADRLNKEADNIRQLAAAEIQKATEAKVAKKIAEVEQRTQSQMAAVKRRAHEESRKAKAAEQAWKRAEEEITRLKYEIANAVNVIGKSDTLQSKTAGTEGILSASLTQNESHKHTPGSLMEDTRLGWISDAYLWETVIGYRKDPAVEALLENTDKDAASARQKPKYDYSISAGGEIDEQGPLLEPKQFDHKALFLRANMSEKTISPTSEVVKTAMKKRTAGIRNITWNVEAIFVVAITLAVIFLAGPDKIYRWVNDQYSAINTNQTINKIGNLFSREKPEDNLESATLISATKNSKLEKTPKHQQK